MWDKLWCVSNGGVSKASRTLHVSEDIFGGFNVVLRGGAVEYFEFIHCGKGRDITFGAVNSFEQKIAGGNSYQAMSRDMNRLCNASIDLFRTFSLFCSGAGFFASNALLTWALFWFVMSQLLLASTLRESSFTTGLAFDLGAGIEQVYAAEWVLQLGCMTGCDRTYALISDKHFHSPAPYDLTLLQL